MARQQRKTPRTLGGGSPDKCFYSCTDKEGNSGAARFLTGCSKYSNCNTCIANENPCGFGGSPPTGTSGGTGSVSGLNMRKATGTSFQRPRQGGTGEHVAWRNQSGTILGYTTQQVLIAVGVGVAAYFLYKKFK